MTYEELFQEVKTLFQKADVSEIKEHIAFQFNIEDEEAGGAFYVEVRMVSFLWSHMSIMTEMQCLSARQRY